MLTSSRHWRKCVKSDQMEGGRDQDGQEVIKR